MNAKYKAKELIDRFRSYVDSEIDGEENFEYSKDQETNLSKKCALIVVDEIIIELKSIEFNNDLNFSDNLLLYWNNVKQEIEKL